MKEIGSATVGFIVASIIPAAVLSILWPLDGTHRMNSMLSSFLAAYPFSLVFTLGLGVPAFLLLRPFRPGNWWSVGAVGFLLGSLVGVVLRLPYLPNPHDVVTDGPLGVISTLAFWLIWRRGTKELIDHTQPKNGETQG
jgi:hypothetical protein